MIFGDSNLIMQDHITLYTNMYMISLIYACHKRIFLARYSAHKSSKQPLDKDLPRKKAASPRP